MRFWYHFRSSVWIFYKDFEAVHWRVMCLYLEKITTFSKILPILKIILQTMNLTKYWIPLKTKWKRIVIKWKIQNIVNVLWTRFNGLTLISRIFCQKVKFCNFYTVLPQNSSFLNTIILFSGELWPKFPWNELVRDFIYHHLHETWNLQMTIFPTYHDFGWKTDNFIMISREIVEMIWIGINRNSWDRTEAKQDSVKCWKLLSSVNFLWTWIHWPITKQTICTTNP